MDNPHWRVEAKEKQTAAFGDNNILEVVEKRRQRGGGSDVCATRPKTTTAGSAKTRP